MVPAVRQARPGAACGSSCGMRGWPTASFAGCFPHGLEHRTVPKQAHGLLGRSLCKEGVPDVRNQA